MPEKKGWNVMRALIGVANLRDQRLGQPNFFHEGDGHVVPSVEHSNRCVRWERDRGQEGAL